MAFLKKTEITSSKLLITAQNYDADDQPRVKVFELSTAKHRYLSLEQTSGGRTRNVVVRTENLDALISALIDLRRIYKPSTNNLGGNS